MKNYSQNLLRYKDLKFSLDLSLMELPEDCCSQMGSKIQHALQEMSKLEAGEIANPDEGRQVGHYWLRAPQLAPSEELRKAITEPLGQLKSFAQQVLNGEVSPEKADRFTNLLIVGIGGSALGPQFIYEALGQNSALKTYFFDNTDPEGLDATLAKIGAGLAETLTLVISKSGGTPETRNGMLEAQHAYAKAGLNFGKHAVAITGEGSKLDQYAEAGGFLARFPMEDWVGGRTSVMSTVGLVPMALQEIDIDAFLQGAEAMDAHTRKPDVASNAGLQLALAWYHEGNGQGEKDMVVLPYKDSLGLFSKYLQQLIMESLGKKDDLDGKVVHQGIAVYGNKGSTDQHAYVQQLRDGLANFFATFIEVRKSRTGCSIEVDPDITSGDYLQGFLRGTRKALAEAGRHSLTISIEEVSPHSVGALIALFERAVGYYASLVNINAYHQPGVEAGKKAAALFLDLLQNVRQALSGEAQTASQIAAGLNADAEEVYHCLNHLAANGKALVEQGEKPENDTFALTL